MSLYVRFALQIYYNYANCATLFASMPEAACRVSPPAAGRLLRQWAWSHIFTRAPGHAARCPAARLQGPFGSAARVVLHGRTARFALRLRPFCNCLPFSPLRSPAPAVAYLYKRGHVCLGSCCVVSLVNVTKNKCFFCFYFRSFALPLHRRSRACRACCSLGRAASVWGRWPWRHGGHRCRSRQVVVM